MCLMCCHGASLGQASASPDVSVCAFRVSLFLLLRLSGFVFVGLSVFMQSLYGFDNCCFHTFN